MRVAQIVVVDASALARELERPCPTLARSDHDRNQKTVVNEPGEAGRKTRGSAAAVAITFGPPR